MSDQQISSGDLSDTCTDPAQGCMIVDASQSSTCTDPTAQTVDGTPGGDDG